MKKLKLAGIFIILMTSSLFALAMLPVPDQCDDNNVINMIPDAPHPFWGSSTTATYGYTDENGCVHSVNCVTKYRVWINFGTHAEDAGILYCN